MAASWHKILLIGILVLLAGLAGWAAFQYPAAIQDLQTPLNKPATGHKVDALSADTIAAQRDQWLNPVPWKMPDTQNQLFTPRRFLFFIATEKIELATPNIKVGPEGGDQIPLDWLYKNGLNASDPDIITADSDGDGFSNFDEFQAGTDPRDPKSHPPYVKLVRLQSSDARPFRLTFSSKNAIGGEDVFQITTPDGKRTSSSVKIGGSFEGFKVLSFTPKEGNKKIGNMVTEGDISELEVENETTGEKVTLVVREEKNVPNVSAVFILLLPDTYDKPVTVNQGHDFTLQAQPRPELPAEPIHLQFLSINADGATAIIPETKEQVVIPLLKPQELDRLKTPPPAPTSS